MYQVIVYEKIGEHGSAGEFYDLESAIKRAKEVDITDNTWYVGAEGVLGEPRFAIIHAEPEYLDVRISEKVFQTTEDYETFKDAIEQHIETGNIIKSEY